MGRLFVLPGRTAEIACRWVCHHRHLSARLAVLTHPSLPPPIAADGVQHTWDTYSETLGRVILTGEAASWLSRVECPTRLIAGDRDRVVDRGYLASCASPGAVSVETWAGGHDLPLAQPDACLRAIAAAVGL
jgi:pimeloyl-ACP methyl ester carboxylesterase